MSQALLRAIANCGRCIQYEAKGQLPPMQPIICTELMEHIQEMLDRGAIRPSQSPWCNAVVLVRKKDGGPLVLY